MWSFLWASSEETYTTPVFLFLPLTTSTHSLTPDVGVLAHLGILRDYLGISQFSSAPVLSTRRPHQTPEPRGKGSAPQVCPADSASDAPAGGWRLPRPLLGFEHFAREAQRTRETFYLLDYQFIIKGQNSETAGWKRRRGQVCGKGLRPSMASPDPSCFPNLHVFTIWEALWKSLFPGLYGGVITGRTD